MNQLFLFYILLYSLNSFAFNIPGEVPLFNLSQPGSRLPAVDLTYKGNIISAEELRSLEIKWIAEQKKILQEGQISKETLNKVRAQDISKLKPAAQKVQKNWVDKLFLVDDGFNYNEGSDLELVRTDETKRVFNKLDSIGVNRGDTLDFIDVAPLKTNNLLDFRVKTKVQQGEVGEQYRIYLGPLSHNMMLRKSLLRKLGYKEPGFKYLKDIKINFSNITQAREFVAGCLNQSVGAGCFGISNTVNEDPRRWVTNLSKKIETTEIIDPDTGEVRPVEIEVWDYDQAIKENGEVTLNIQDVVIYKETGELRLALGFIPHDTHARQRIYNSLLMAFNLIDIPESINSLSPIPFSVKSKKLILTHNYGRSIYEFSPDIYDVKWMARKLASLSRKDFKHLVESAYYPKEVEALLVELLIARRNFMQDFFFSNDKDCKGQLAYTNLPYYCLGANSPGVDKSISQQFVPNLKLSMPPRLVDGRLTIDTRGGEFTNPEKWWVGFGTRFSYNQIESPLVFSEVLSYFRSILQSSLLDAIINKNVNDLLKVDKQGKSIDLIREASSKNSEYFTDYVNELIAAGDGPTDHLTLKEVPFSFQHFPTASGQLILNRNVIIGTQNGVDNQVQLVDTFGFIAKAGVHGQAVSVQQLDLFNDFDSKVGEPLIGYDLDFTFLKRWTHLRPIIVEQIPGVEKQAGAIEKALKEKYNKIIIPKMLRDFKKEILNLPEYNEESSEEEKQAYTNVLNKNYEALNKYLKPGESLIISTSIGPSFNANIQQIFNSDPSQLAKPITGSGELVLNFLAQYEDLTRVHIRRTNSDSILIYKTKANQVTWETTVSYKKFIPITKLRFKRISGQAKTMFYNLRSVKPTIGDAGEVNPNFNTDLNIVIETLQQDKFSGSEDFDDNNLLINRSYSPYIVWHKFKQNQFNFRFLFYNLATHGLFDEVELYSPYNEALPSFPDGESTKYARASRGIRQGVNYQKVALDIVNLIFQNEEKDFDLKITGGNDPADTLFGKSASLSVVLDAKVSGPSPGVLRNYKPEFMDPFLKLHYKWKGGVDFGLTPSKARKLFSEINGKLNLSEDYKLFEEAELSKLDRLQLYQANVDLVIYKEGFEKLFKKSPYEFSMDIKRKIKVDSLLYMSWNKPNERKEELKQDILRTITQSYYKAHGALAAGKYKKFMMNATWIVQLLQQHLNFKDFISLFENINRQNGKVAADFRNIYIKGFLTGFKKGDERIEPIVANEVGFPRKKSVNGSEYDYTFGDLELVKNKIGISDGEFYLNWLMESYL